MRWLLALPLLLLSFGAAAIEMGPVRLDFHGMVGNNSTQGVYYGLGADVYTYVEDHLAVGLGGYYTAGQHPNLDQETGAGPFVSYAYPILDFLVPSVREDIDYVNERDPIDDAVGTPVDYQTNYGVASITSVAVHLFFTRNFGVGVGYRFALGLNNSNLEKSHSGVFFGLAFGF